jgi:hypothetical protein
MIMDVVFEALPPCVDIPPAWEPVKPKRLAKVWVIFFSITVRAGETWKTWTFVFKTARSNSDITPTFGSLV